MSETMLPAGSPGPGMRLRRRAGRSTGQALLSCALLLGLIGLAACGSAGAPGSAAAEHAGRVTLARSVPGPLRLCRSPAAVSRVLIGRATIMRQLHPAEPVPPLTLGTASGNRARALAMALCALPRMPRRAVHCPAQFYGYETLTFTAGGRRLPPVRIQLTGCQVITGLRPARWAVQAPRFWAALAAAAGASSQPGAQSQPGSRVTCWPRDLPPHLAAELRLATLCQGLTQHGGSWPG